MTFEIDHEHEVGPPWAASVSEDGIEYLTKRHYDWIDHVNRCCCDHEAIIVNSRVEFVSCPDCIDDFMEFVREHGLNVEDPLEFTTDSA